VTTETATKAGGTSATPQAAPAPAPPEEPQGLVPPALNGAEWQNIKTVAELLRTHSGRMATSRYEVFSDDYGCVHIIVGKPQTA
jgi:hypothetical protein